VRAFTSCCTKLPGCCSSCCCCSCCCCSLPLLVLLLLLRRTFAKQCLYLTSSALLMSAVSTSAEPARAAKCQQLICRKLL
jgi:hypothetical protein